MSGEGMKPECDLGTATEAGQKVVLQKISVYTRY